MIQNGAKGFFVGLRKFEVNIYSGLIYKYSGYDNFVVKKI
jgi:hypothetical protein